MPKSYSDSAKASMNAVSGDEPLLLLLEINHPDLPQPIRVVNDNQNITHLTNTYTAMAFSVKLPDEREQGLPRAEISIDNIGRELTDWLDLSGGGQGSTVRFMHIKRSMPDLIEWEATLDLFNVSQTTQVVSGTLGYQDVLNLPAVAVTYIPSSHPGLF
jgi:hypothetical protein